MTVVLKKKSGRLRRVILVVLITVLAWPLLAWIAARVLIVRAELPHADAILVLAGSSTYLERTRKAAALFAEGRAPVILLTNDNVMGGWSNADQRNLFFIERATRELRNSGVPADRIEVVPQFVTSTYSEAVAAREHAAARGWRSIIVVTSAYHSRRALWTFRRVFHDSNIAIGIDPAPAGQDTPPLFTWWWHKSGWHLVPNEYVKLIYYRISY